MAEDSLHLRMLLPNDPWVRAIHEGAVTEPGLTWESIASGDQAPQRFQAAASGGLDVGENMARHMAVDVIAGKPATGVPIFLGRELMQRNVFVRSDNKMKRMWNLAGKRVGSNLPLESGTGAGVALMLERGFDVDLSSVEWFCGRNEAPPNRMGLKISRGPATKEELFEAVMRG